MEFKIVVNDVKTGKSYQKTVNNEAFLGKKLGEKVEGNLVGLKDYELKITGGSDKAGFPMRKDIEIVGRKKVLSGNSTGIKVKEKGIRIRKTVRGGIISDQTAQINLKVEKYGSESLDNLLGKKEEAPKSA